MKLIITNIFSWMVKNFDLISIIVATCLTWISRFDFSRSVTVIIRDQSAPERFFPSSSYVTDYPNGSLSKALKTFYNENIILIYSYSHWDAESFMHRDDIEKVTGALQYKIPIISINCWDNNSDCYEILKPNRFPQIYVYISNSYFIQYKRSIEPMEILKFLSSLYYPFYFPKSLSDLEILLKLSDASFILCLNSESNRFSSRIKIFHKISTIYKGENANRPDINFIVLSSSDSDFIDIRKSFNLTTNEAVLYNSMGIQKYAGKFRVNDVLKFLKTNSLKPVINKYSSSGVKSLNMQNLLKSGFVMFYVYDESQKYLWNNVKSYFYFKSLAMHMTSCTKGSNSPVSDFTHFLKEQTINRYLNYHKDNLTCQLYFQSQIFSTFSWDIKKYLQLLDLNTSSHSTSYQQDPFVAHSVLLDINWFCRKALLMKHGKSDDIKKLSENIKPLLFNSTENASFPYCFNDLNRSISFAEIEGNKFSLFLKKWGITTTPSFQPYVIVIDWKHEIIHQMESEISQHSLNDLVQQIVINNLTSHLKSNEYVFRDLFHPNFYPIDAIKLEQELMDTETDLVVFYYTPWCSYCSSMMHMLIMLGRYFRNYPKLHFASLDTFNNDLPYKYQSERIPALIMFPRGRKSDSFVFQITEKSVSLSSLVRFVLENSGDVNLNLNSPSVNYNNEYNVTCDLKCLESAHQSVFQLLKSLKQAFKDLGTRIRVIRMKIDDFCSSDLYHWFSLKADKAKDWLDYRIKQYYWKYQAQLVWEFNSLLRRQHLLFAKVLKLAKLNKGIIHMLGKKSMNKPVQTLALDILNFSI